MNVFQYNIIYHSGSEHTEHIAKRDVHVSNVSQLAVQDMSSTYPIPSLKQEGMNFGIMK